MKITLNEAIRLLVSVENPPAVTLQRIDGSSIKLEPLAAYDKITSGHPLVLVARKGRLVKIFETQAHHSPAASVAIRVTTAKWAKCWATTERAVLSPSPEWQHEMGYAAL